jgi:hypothetical protein
MRNLFAILLLCIATPATAKTITATVSSAGDRQVPVTIITPDRGKVKGIILFSHGALSSPAKYSELTTPWSTRGFAIIAPLHADSADWAGTKPAMADQTAWRMADMAAVIADLPGFGRKAGFTPGKLPLIAAGHSFGALIAMSISDPNIVSVLAFSPPGPLPGITLPVVSKPMFTVTGTADAHPMIAPKWEAHLTAHQQSTGLAWAYVGKDADHYFGGIYCRPELPGPKQWEPYREALGLSETFLDASLRMNRNGKGPKLLEKAFKGFAPKSGTLSAR